MYLKVVMEAFFMALLQANQRKSENDAKTNRAKDIAFFFVRQIY